MQSRDKRSPIFWRALVLPVLALLCLEAFPSAQLLLAADQDTLEVRAEPGGDIKAVARVKFPARPDIVLAMLTDYAHWPQLFEVRMRVVAVKMQEGVATVDLRIDHALLPGEQRLVTESRSPSAGTIVTDLVAGDFKKYHRVWKLTPANGGAQTLADFELIVAIDSIVPDWLVALATRRELESHFRIVKGKAIERTKEGK